ncbi:hypothetical protein [Chitinophaga sp. Cy-1792]|uniref:hypothetical protein n=1 Tax=Chitinophaga sp. Cy-1792 TaxID=2608339 RepID=UPI00141E3653|nr:hypothetical protein [Chitinophaga sp. Cy-1792]NIG55254.1 hypothetical protein [Chitinophaga sp. Cy-1792]
MATFIKKTYQTPLIELIITLFTALFHFSPPAKRDSIEDLQFKNLLLILVIIVMGFLWANYLLRWCVCKVEIDNGVVTVTWKNRIGKEKQESDAVANLYWQWGHTESKDRRETMSLMQRKGYKSFAGTIFMQVVDGKDGGNKEQLADLYTMFQEAGIAEK